MPKRNTKIKQKSELEKLGNQIAKKYVFDQKHYPKLKGKSKSEIRDFALQHSLLHVQKSGGKLATALEEIDHGAAPDRITLEEEVSKLLINTIKLAEVIKIKPSKLVSKASKILTRKH